MTQEVLFNQEASIGFITLNRPEALNALTLSMIIEIQRQLQAWEQEDSVHAILLMAAPSKAFCAGGDVRWLYHFGQGHNPEQMQFFWHEYRMNHFIHKMKKPYVALMDGMTMGGGVGVSLHGSHPVATERFVFSMPETSIGFFPDIGASHLLTQCPGSLGVYLGLTGARLGPEEALKAGLVKYVIASESIPKIVDELMHDNLSENAHSRVHSCLARHVKLRDREEDSEIHSLIQSCFSQPEVEQILSSLQASNQSWAQETGLTLAQKSPLSLKVTLAQLQKAKGLPLSDCLKMDFNIVSHFMQGSEFYEGIRALLIDKDKNPQWNPQSLELVTRPMVEDYFRSFSELEL